MTDCDTETFTCISALLVELVYVVPLQVVGLVALLLTREVPSAKPEGATPPPLVQRVPLRPLPWS